MAISVRSRLSIGYRDDIYGTAHLIGLDAREWRGRQARHRDPRGKEVLARRQLSARAQQVVRESAAADAASRSASAVAGASGGLLTYASRRFDSARLAQSNLQLLGRSLAGLQQANANLVAFTKSRLVAKAQGGSAHGRAVAAAQATAVAAALTATARELQAAASRQLARAVALAKHAAALAKQATTHAAALLADAAVRSAAIAAEVAAKSIAAARQATATAVAATKTAAQLTAQAVAAVVTAPFQ